MFRDRSRPSSRLRVPLLCTAFASLGVVLAVGQGLGGGGGGGGGQNLPWKSYTLSNAVGAGAYGRSCSGDFDGDTFEDLALLRGSEIVVVSAPGSSSWWLPSGYLANDIATRPPIGAAPERRFVAVGDGGAHQYFMTPSGALWRAQLAGGAWVSAVLVDAGKTLIGAFLEERIVGVMSDRRSVFELHRAGGNWVTTEITLTPALGADALDMMLVDMDGNQELEIALVTADGLSVYDLNGNRDAAYSYPGHVTTSLASGVQAAGKSWLAWTTVKNGTEYVTTYDENGLVSLSSLGNPGVVASSSALWSADTRSDLVLSLTSGELWVLTNTGLGLPIFSTSNYTAIDLGEPLPGNAAWPAATDVNKDGFEDLLFPHPSGPLTVHLNALSQPLLPVIAGFEDGLELSTLEPLNCSGENPPNFRLLLSVSEPAAGSGANAISYAAWKQADPGSGAPSTWSTDPTAVVLETTQEFDGSGAVLLTIELPWPDSFGCGPTSVISTHIYHVEFQLKEVVPGYPGQVLNTFPATILGIETQSAYLGLPNAEYLKSIGVAGTRLGIGYAVLEGGDTGIGLSYEMTEIPNLTPGVAIVK